MNIWTIKEICKILDIEKIKSKINFSGISIDSRTIKKGNLYIPIKGKNFDGHDYIDNAFKKGAFASLTANYQKIKDYGKPIIFVKDTQKALIKIAQYSRVRNKNLVNICITGSSGKTTLKEWIFEILKEYRPSYCNKGNLNNEIGMPLTLSNMPKNTKFCILELGMNSPGEIKRLSKIAIPKISIITNIGTAHSGNFRKLEEIANEKSDIFSFLDKKSIAIIPGDTRYREKLFKKALKNTKNIYSFGSKDFNEFKIEEKMQKGFTTFKILNQRYKIKNKNTFLNWEKNIILILGLAKLLKIKITTLLPKLTKLKPIEGRGKIKKITIQNKVITIIDESYNASPESLHLAIKNLENFNSSHSRRICIIGDMLELGKLSKSFHIDATKTIIEVKPNIVITVGNHSKFIFQNLPKEFLKFHYKNYDKVLNKLLRIMKNKDIIMIKGSNAVNLHLITKKLYELGK